MIALIDTDEGAIQVKGSLLGFVLADDDDANIFIPCFVGQPSGQDPLPFKPEICEICVFLAAVRFVIMLIVMQ